MTFLTGFLSLNQQQAFLAAMLSASGSLAAIAVTLLAIVPTLIEIAGNRTSDYFTGEAARKKIKNALSRLRHTLILYGVVMLLAAIGLLIPTNGVVVLCAVVIVATLFFIATLILIQASYSLTNTTLKAL